MDINDICGLDEAIPNVIDLRHISAKQLAQLGMMGWGYRASFACFRASRASRTLGGISTEPG